MALTSAVNKNTIDLARLESELRASDQSIDRRVAEALRNHTSLTNASVPDLGNGPPPDPRAAARESTYWRCRRSLRLWPITGDLVAGVYGFLLDHLDFDLEAMDPEAAGIQVRRVVEPRSKIKDEVIVEFATASIRDTVKGSGFKLEGKNAGIRMELPVHLRSDFHVLQNMAFHLKSCNPGMKRSIKFDDSCHGLILDVQMQGEDWQRIRPDQARQAGRSNPALRAGPREMSGEMIAGAATPHPHLAAIGSQRPAARATADHSTRGPSSSRPTASGGNTEPLGPGRA